MSFSYDLASNVGKLRLLIGDTSNTPTAAKFSNEELQALLDFEGGSLYLAAADACDSLATKLSSSTLAGQSVKIGDYQQDSLLGEQTKSLQTMAERFRMLELETPAFAIAEENLSEFNQLNIIRNYVLRTLP